MSEKGWHQELVDAHPHLFVRIFRGVAFAPGYPVCADGWKDIIARLVARVSRAAHGYPVRFTQIVAQHGVLRVHWTSQAKLPRDVELSIEHAIALAQARSACTCADCGERGQLFSSASRLFTACPTHQRGIPVPVMPDFDGVYVIRALVDEKSTLVCRRYDRASDSFVEFAPEPAPDQ